MKQCFFVVAALLLLSAYALAADVQPGVDLFESPPDGLSSIEISLPADFFGPGSDPFDGRIYLRGKSLKQWWDFGHMEQLPINSLGPTCCIVERLATAMLPDVGTADTIPVEIVALRLVSIEPIVVTYFGGLTPEPWDLEVTLSSYQEQGEGMMTIYQEYNNGGTYEVDLPVVTRLTLTRVADCQEAVMDPGPVAAVTSPPVPPWPNAAGACWSHSVPFPIVQSEGNTLVDHDGNMATPRRLVRPSSNFVCGGCGFTALGERPGVPDYYKKVLAQWQDAVLSMNLQPANPLDHFKVYDVEDVPVSYSAALLDQFDEPCVPQDVELDRIEYFANPVDKNYEGMADPMAHLLWYHFEPTDPSLRWVDIQNQFINCRLYLLPAEYLLVPANKNEDGYPWMLDHYKAYRVIHGKYINKVAHLLDQWTFGDQMVKKPVWFCTPVDKNGEGIINDFDHIVFYEIEPPQVFDPLLEFYVLDQFYTDPPGRMLYAESSLWLGVPSDKLQWGSWDPTGAELCSFDAARHDGRVEVAWETAIEMSCGGFNVHRGLEENGPVERINGELIPAKGNELEGATYSFTDSDVLDGHDYYYWVESVDLSGTGTMHGPVIVAAADESPVPAAFGLAQNHPNPFNPVTEIKYNLPVDCYVTLEVYDVLGRTVATLVNEYQTAGFKSALWEVNSEIASGVYFYKLQAGSFVETKKMVLLR